MEGVRKGSDGKWEGREGKRRGRRKGGKRRGSSHTFCFSNLGSSAHQSPLLDLVLHFPAIRQMAL